MRRLCSIADKDTLHRRIIPSAILLFILLIFTANALGISYLSSSAAFGISFNFTPLQLSPIVGSLEFNVMMTAGLLLSLLLPWLSPIQGSLLTLCCAIVPVYVNYTHPGRQTLLPMEYVLLTMLIMFAIDILIAWFEETRQKQRIVQLFGQYIPPQLAQTLTQRPELVDLGGESKIMTVLFSDLQNFTSMSEQLNTKQLVRLLNDYLTVMSEILYEYKSTIDKYIGDAIMSFWGAPLPQPDHATLAVRAALKMQEAMETFSVDYGKRGWPKMKMGIGINTGRMSVGNMGSKYRLAYTVMGDAVNLASRLEGLTRVYRAPVIVGEATMRETSGIVYRELDTVQVRGKHKSCRIFQPLCAESEQSGDLKERLVLHRDAIDAWYKGDLASAQAIFGRLASLNPDDAYYPVMLGRIAEKMN